MIKSTKKDISTVISGFEKFFDHMVKTQGFDLNEFLNFMEPRFAAAGYRNAQSDTQGGNILILTETGVGDFVLSTGLIREIRRLYPSARITLLVRPAAFNLAETCPYVNEVILDSQGVLPINLLEFYKLNLQTAHHLLEHHFDICFAAALHPKTFLLMYMSGAKIRVTAIKHEQYNSSSPNRDLSEVFMRLATNLFTKIPAGLNMADRFFSLPENLLYLPITNRKLEIWYTPADFGIAKSYLREASDKIYSLNMGGSNRKKHYPPEKYVRLLEMILAEDPTATFLILGGGQSDLNSAMIIKSVAPELYENHIIDLTNKLSYRQSAAVLSLCKMHIGNDTGTMHVAAAVGCPVLSPNCFAVDLANNPTDTLRIFYPYGVPSVIVQPQHMLPECKNLNSYDAFGCLANFPHCITQIDSETLFKGFHLLKERIAQKINEPIYIH